MNILNVALAVPLADNHDNGMMSDIGAGWWIVMIPMMVLFMGAMMWMMMRGMSGGSSSDSTAPKDRLAGRESPLETLERRLAEGEISIDEYRERCEALVAGSAEPSGDDDHEKLPAPRAGEGRR